MAHLVSAKNLLVSYDPTVPINDKGEKYRGTHHEFQDYAYRLAADLNDLEHLNLYMRLARNYPRFLLERVYEFIADIDEYNKGKLFMWKFKQLRKDIQLQKDLQNTDYAHVIKKMKELYNKFAKEIIKKEENLSTNNLANMLININFEDLSENAKILFLGCHSPSIILSFITNKRKIFGLDVSHNITSQIKEKLEHTRGTKVITKEFFQNKYKDGYFDLIIVDKYWQLIPLEKENDFIRELRRITKPQGKFFITSKHGNEDQTWRELKISNEMHHYFEKINDTTTLLEKLQNNNLKCLSTIEKNNLASFIIQN